MNGAGRALSPAVGAVDLRRAASLGAFGTPGLEPPPNPLHAARDGERGAELARTTLRRVFDAKRKIPTLQELS